MKSTYKNHTFKCPVCKSKQIHKVWSDNAVHLCDTDGCDYVLKPTDLVKEKQQPRVPAIKTPTKNRF